MLNAFQQELLSVLRAYSRGGSLSDFRAWEVSVTDTDEVPEEERADLDRLALSAENVMVGVTAESEFRATAEAAIRRLEPLSLVVTTGSASTVSPSLAPAEPQFIGSPA